MEDYKQYTKIFGKIIKWLPKIYRNFQPFRPEAKYFEINYKSKTAMIRYFLAIPPSIRKRIGKIEIPKYGNYNIKSFMDDTFNDLSAYIKINEEGNSWVIKTNQLPSCENFLMELKGQIDRNFMDKLVNVKPARNKDSTQTYDKYWLDVMIRDVSILEKMYDKLEVNNIDCIVKVNIEKNFTIDMPKPLIRSINAMKNYVYAGLGTNRQEVFNTWRTLRVLSRKWDLKFLEESIKQLSSNLVLKNYIEIDNPFYLGEINNPEVEKIVPSYFSVEALTNLTLKVPAANGYLKFHKKNYQKEIKKEVGTDWNKYSKRSEIKD